MIKSVYVLYENGKKLKEFKHFSDAVNARDAEQRRNPSAHLVIEPESYAE